MFPIQLIRSKRKTLSIEISKDGAVIARAPFYMPEDRVMSFVRQKESWILSKRQEILRTPKSKPISPEMREILRGIAKERIPARVAYWSRVTGLKCSSVKVTSAEKRFGSCNGQNGLCYSLYLANYPEDLLDYVIVHELCHTKEHNHSLAFYQLVSSILPDWEEREARLRTIPLPHIKRNE